MSLIKTASADHGTRKKGEMDICVQLTFSILFSTVHQNLLSEYFTTAIGKITKAVLGPLVGCFDHTLTLPTLSIKFDLNKRVELAMS